MWTDVSVWREGYKFCIPICKILKHEQILDMKKGALHRITTFKDPAGKIMTFETVRLVFMHNVHLGYMMVKVTPRNFSGPIRILSGLNGDVCNRGFFPREMLKHLQLERIERGRVFMYIEMKTRERGIRISEAASWKLVSPLSQVKHGNRESTVRSLPAKLLLRPVRVRDYVFEKLVVVATSREFASEDVQGYNLQAEIFCSHWSGS